MKLLLTNDDGLESRGILYLAEQLEKENELFVVAPDRNRSGVSQAITLHDTLTIKYKSERYLSCSGTPADCVLAALKGDLLPWTPDLVLSGINLGPNAANDIIYSGTCAAARQASMLGIPAIAMSVAERNPHHAIDHAAHYIAAHLGSLFSEIRDEAFLNINFPAGFSGDAELKRCVPGRRYYQDEYLPEKKSDGSVILSLVGNPFHSKDSEGLDTYAIDQGQISLSLIHSFPLVHKDEMPLLATGERSG